jgi:hypothetical protein
MEGPDELWGSERLPRGWSWRTYEAARKEETRRFRLGGTPPGPIGVRPAAPRAVSTPPHLDASMQHRWRGCCGWPTRGGWEL